MTAKTGKSMDAKANQPKPASREYVIKGAKSGPNAKRYGKLTPRDRPADRVAPARYQPTCLECGYLRDRSGPVRWLKCAVCAPEDKR